MATETSAPPGHLPPDELCLRTLLERQKTGEGMATGWGRSQSRPAKASTISPKDSERPA
jgi:hypothetical protein